MASFTEQAKLKLVDQSTPQVDKIQSPLCIMRDFTTG
jgi:hypothetical protein